MSPNSVLTPFRRDLLLAVAALIFLASPVGVLATNISETTYTYERVEVVVDDEDGITYAGNPDLYESHLSEDIGCSVPQDARVCAFERQLVANGTVSTGTTNYPPPSPMFDVGIDRYQYVQIDGSVYEPTYVVNRSAQNDDGYRIDLALNSTSAQDALRDVSIDTSSGGGETPSVIVEAAERGTASADRKVEIPQTPIRVGDDTFYRVYWAGENEPAPLGPYYGVAISLSGPIVGIAIIYRLTHRFEITHLGKD